MNIFLFILGVLIVGIILNHIEKFIRNLESRITNLESKVEELEK